MNGRSNERTALMIDSYIAMIARRLPGPSSRRADLLDEIRDHLYEETRALRERGIPEELSARRAVESFGSVNRLVRDLRAELARRQTTRSAFVLLAGAPGLALLWIAILLMGPHAPWTEVHEPVPLAFSDAVGSTAMLITIAAALLANLLLWLPVRWRFSSEVLMAGQRWAVRVCSLAAATLVVNIVCILSYVSLRGYLAPHSLSWITTTIGVGATLFALKAVASTLRDFRSQRSGGTRGIATTTSA